MTKPNDLPDDILGFYEKIGSQGNEVYEQTRQDTAYERPSGLNEEQLAKLSDDLLRPLSEPSDDYDENQ